jgi:hypothetical protein
MAAADPPASHVTSEDSSNNNNTDFNPVADLRPGLRSRPKIVNTSTLKDAARSLY